MEDEFEGVDEGMEELRKTWGDDTEDNVNMLRGEIAPALEANPLIGEMLDRTGLGNDPKLIIELMNKVGSGKTLADREKEIISIMTDPANPKNQLWKAGNRQIREEIHNFYRDQSPGNKPANCPTSQRIVIDVPR